MNGTYDHIPVDLVERRLWARRELRKLGSSFVQLSRQHGRSQPWITFAFSRPNYPAEKALADALSIPIERLFPERYDAEGNRLHYHHVGRERNKPQGVRNVKDSAAV